MLRLERERLENEQVERALREVEPVVVHECPLRLLQER